MENLTQYDKPSTAGIALKYGLYAGLAQIILSLVINLTELNFSKMGGLITFVLSLAIGVTAIVFACKEFRENNKGALSLGEAIGVGTLLSAISGLLSGIFTTIYIKLIDTTFVEKTIENSRRQMEQDGKLTDEQIDQAIEMSRPFAEGFMTFSFVTGPIFGAIIGLILSLIIGLIMKKDRDVFAQ